MRRVYMLILVCISTNTHARIHTVLNKETIANYQHQKIQKSHNNKFADIVSAAAIKHNVDENLIHAIIQTESAYNPTASSPKQAVGLMQLIPETAERFGVKDRTDPIQNINGGTKYLKYLMALFDSDLTLVISAYNAGENAVIKYGNKIPPYPETKDYVKKVLARM